MTLSFRSPGTACARTGCSGASVCSHCPRRGPDLHSVGLGTQAPFGPDVTPGGDPASVKIPTSLQVKEASLATSSTEMPDVREKLPARSVAAGLALPNFHSFLSLE